MMISFLTLDESKLAETASLFAHYGTRWLKLHQPRDVRREDDILRFTIGSGMGFISLLPAPIPGDELEVACSLAFYWPEAGATIRQHKAHVIVGIDDAALNPIARAQMLTRLVDSVAQGSGASGIVWGAGMVVTPPQLFCSGACDLDENPYPIPLWVSFRPESHEDGSISLSTHGLAELGHREVEVHHAQAEPRSVLEHVGDFAFYIIQKGPIVNDGDTFGYTAEDKIKVHHRKKGRWFEEPVYELEFS